MRHAHLFPCLGVTGVGTGQVASSHRPSICHDIPGKNTVKYYFFISFITLTRLNPEAPLALSGEVLPCPWHPACPWHKSADCRAPGRGSLARSNEMVGTGGARPQGDNCPATARPRPTKAAITVTSRDSLAWRHRAGWGHPLGNPEPEVSCFWASLQTRWIQGGTVRKLCPSPTESWCLHTAAVGALD